MAGSRRVRGGGETGDIAPARDHSFDVLCFGLKLCANLVASGLAALTPLRLDQEWEWHVS